jgi:hypothetical protein
MDTMFRMNLRLFDGGAAAGAPSGGEAGGNATGSNAGLANQTKPEKVVYGIQDEPETGAEPQAKETNANDETETKSDPVDKGKAFEDMIKGDYKEQFDARVKQILERRFKAHDELEKFKADSQEILDIMFAKYGVKDLKGLQKAVQEDDSYFEEAAAAEDLSVEQYKYKLKLEKENAAKDKALREMERRENARRAYADWQRQAESLKTRYPNFSLESEAANPQFAKLLQNGIDVKTAFETIHHDEILSGAMMQTAQAVRKNVTESIKARGLRPSENGINAQAGVIVKNDVSKLTPKDRAEIARRARMGETIKF